MRSFFSRMTNRTIPPRLPKEVIAEQFIAADSDLRTVTHKNFADNLDRILERCSNEDVHVILSNLVCNLKDQPPLGTHVKQAVESREAAQYYQQGLEEAYNGDTLSAYASYLKACDTDVVPFRAGSALNTIIREKAGEHHMQFVDMSAVFRQASSEAIPGDNLFCDHLHPNPEGYRLMAGEFRRAVDLTGLLPESRKTAMNTNAPLYVTGLDWEIGGIRIYKLKHHWPFDSKKVDYTSYPPYENETSAGIAKSYLFEHHIWGKAHDELARYYEENGQMAEASREYQAIIAMDPERNEYYPRVIDNARAARNWAMVGNTCLKALQISEHKGLFYYNLSLAEQMTGQVQRAMKHIQQAINAPETTDTQRAHYYLTYATQLLDTGQKDKAVDLLQRMVRDLPDYTPAGELLRKLTG